MRAPTGRRPTRRSAPRARRFPRGRCRRCRIAPTARRGRQHDPRAQGRARSPAVARGRQDAARRRRRSQRAPARSSSSSRGEALRLAGEKIPSVRPGVDVEVTREPIGVVGIITPWNFPIAIPAWKIAPALAYGNCVVFKPAELVPGSAWALAEIIVKRRRAQGRVQPRDGTRQHRRRGDDQRPPRRCASASPARSRPAARSRQRRSRAWPSCSSKWAARIRLVVLDDADLGVAVNCAVNGAFFSTGQRCTASSRLIVGAGIHDRFVAALSERLDKAQGRRCAGARDRHRPGGRRGQLKQDLEYIGIGQQRRREARLAGGEVLKRAKQGYYLSPALLTERYQRDAHRRARKSSGRLPA